MIMSNLTKVNEAKEAKKTLLKALIQQKNETVIIQKQPKTEKIKRIIYGKELSSQLPSEVRAMISTINKLEPKYYDYQNLYSQYLFELSLISKSKSNLQTRFDRLLYRNSETAIVKGSIQAVKFNLKTQLSGLSIKAKNPIQYRNNGDADLSSLRDNSFMIKLNKGYKRTDSLQIDSEIKARIKAFKGE
jgi:hypothetical protein